MRFTCHRCPLKNTQHHKVSFSRYNKLSIELYAEAAFDAFTLAQAVAPVTPGTVLNLLQSSLRIMEKPLRQVWRLFCHVN